jgi:chorismate mutase
MKKGADALRKKNDLDTLRKEIKAVTLEIVQLVGKRLSLAKKIGKIKRQKGLPIENLEVEDKLRRVLLKKCGENNVDSDFCLRLFNLLTDEAKKVQIENETDRTTHRKKEDLT